MTSQVCGGLEVVLSFSLLYLLPYHLLVSGGLKMKEEGVHFGWERLGMGGESYARRELDSIG